MHSAEGPWAYLVLRGQGPNAPNGPMGARPKWAQWAQGQMDIHIHSTNNAAAVEHDAVPVGHNAAPEKHNAAPVEHDAPAGGAPCSPFGT